MVQINTGMILQARMGSSRLPGKMCMKIMGRELLYHMIERLKAHGILERFPLVIATTTDKEDQQIVRLGKEMGVQAFCGSKYDITKRMIDAAEEYGMEKIIRLQGDDPLVDPLGILSIYETHLQKEVDLTTGAHGKGWIVGTASMVIERRALIELHKHFSNKDKKRLYNCFVPLKDNLIKTHKVEPPEGENRKDIFLTVDYPEDFKTIKKILTYFLSRNKRYLFENREVIELFDRGILSSSNRHLHEPFED